MKNWPFNRLLSLIFIAFSLLIAGCWDQFELTELGFVEALAIDQGKGNSLRLTTQFIKPTIGEGVKTTYENLETEASTISEAVRDIPLKLGRKAKWDHLKVILISEQIAKQKNLFEMLDFFRRGYEPRGTINIILTKGNARDFLNKKTFIYETSGMHLHNILEKSFQFNAKVIPTTLYDFDQATSSEVEVAMLPYIENKNDILTIAGLALLKKGQMMDYIPTDDVKKLIMLTNQYKGGSLEIPCSGKNTKESFEILSARTHIDPVIQKDKVIIRVFTKIEGSPFQLSCHTLKTPQEEEKYANVVKQALKEKLEYMLNMLKRKKIDALAVGNKIYYQNPQQWKKWKRKWSNIFAQSDYQVHVKVQVTNKGMQAK